jgi:hypothetical protein
MLNGFFGLVTTLRVLYKMLSTTLEDRSFPSAVSLISVADRDESLGGGPKRQGRRSTDAITTLDRLLGMS